MRTLNITEAKAQLSAVVREVADEGGEVLITRAGRPVVKVVRYAPARRNRRLGLWRGKIALRPDLDEWPPDLARALGIAD